MFLIDNITSFISKCKAQRAASNAAERKRFAERDALARFNISSFDGKPVILYGDGYLCSERQDNWRFTHPVYAETS